MTVIVRVGSITVENVSKSYGGVRALDNVTVGIEKGSAVCIAGPNGSGKTTLLNIMTGTIEPDSGKVEINGMVGYCYQVPRALRDLTVKENVEIFKELYNVSGEWAEEAIEITSLKEFLGFKVENLSYGMQKRVELCISLLPNAEIMVFDEPTTGLDSETVGEILDLIRKMKGKKTIIIATHQLKDLNGLCDQLVILKNGRVVFQTGISKDVDLAKMYSKQLE